MSKERSPSGSSSPSPASSGSRASSSISFDGDSDTERSLSRSTSSSVLPALRFDGKYIGFFRMWGRVKIEIIMIFHADGVVERDFKSLIVSKKKAYGKTTWTMRNGKVEFEFPRQSKLIPPTKVTCDLEENAMTTHVMINNNPKDIHTRRFLFLATPTTDDPKEKLPLLSVDPNDVEIAERIADSTGSGAIIYACYISGFQCAMKEFDVDTVIDPAMMENEISVIEELPKHPNLVQYLFHRRTEIGGREKVQLFMTRYSLTLQQLINKKREKKSSFTEHEVVTMALSIARGLHALHASSIIHRDLKTSNIFVTLGPQGETKRLVVGDFDTAKSLANGGASPKTIVGTTGFMAPEVIGSNNRDIYTYQADVWSFGMVLYTLMTLRIPYDGSSYLEATRLAEQGIVPDISAVEHHFPSIIRVFKKCLQLKPRSRPTSKRLESKFQRLADRMKS
eukprot:TRINITY_DN3597_c0_g1_i1.p1 TRINITY_DN3597_c0_g1~~TRINITY_DN3597_c0_g1_i1.p1  ORF type:complete len:451 (-),score=91.80 TRINITY_DN3597_c0_g1_i1:145-1497(-)